MVTASAPPRANDASPPLTPTVTAPPHQTRTPPGAFVRLLPRSQVRRTEWDQEWQDKSAKVVRRVAKDLIANDETEISEVVRRRLFENLGNEKIRRNVSKEFGDWCFERRAQLL